MDKKSLEALAKEERLRYFREWRKKNPDTNLDNPNSVVQVKQWLSDNGVETESLGKKNVAALIKTSPEDQRDVLLLRQQLAKSSVKKYQAMQNTVCLDGRARGMFQYYGASRSGRWAGRHIQLQNLPQNHIPDLEDARSLVKLGDYDAVKLLYCIYSSSEHLDMNCLYMCFVRSDRLK